MTFVLIKIVTTEGSLVNVHNFPEREPLYS